MSYHYILVIILIIFFIFILRNKKKSQSTLLECCICHNVFDELQTHEENNLIFCQRHFKDYIENEWVIVEEVESHPDTPEIGVILYEKSLENYKNGELGFIKASYKESDGEIITSLSYYKKKPSN